MIKLRDYQFDLIEAVKATLRRGKKAPLLVSPTGSGKTVMFCHIANEAGKKGKRVWILVHRQELVDQTSKTMTASGVAHGIIAAGFPLNPLHHVQIVSVQTVSRKLENVRFRPDILIIDECHHAAAGTWAKIIDFFKNAVVIGFTATPERLDGKGLASAFDEIIKGPEVAWLIKKGFLTTPKYFSPPNALDLDSIPIVAGDYKKDAVEAAADKPTITGDAVEHYRRLCPGVPAVAFCTSIKHAKHVAEVFSAAGYAAAVIDGSLSRQERRAMVADLASGVIQILVSCEILSEGFDIPTMGAAILLRPTKSLAMHLQHVGRVLRIAPGKKYAFILDHVGNCVRHGLAEQEREWSLQGRKKRKNLNVEQVDVKQCPKCYACHEPATSCPECGYIYPLKTRSEIEKVDGQLIELPSVFGRTPTAEELERDRIILSEIAEKRGKKTGWVEEIMQARIANNATAPVDPSANISQWKGIPVKLSKAEILMKETLCTTYDELVSLAREIGKPRAHLYATRIWNKRNRERKKANGRNTDHAENQAGPVKNSGVQNVQEQRRHGAAT